MDNFVRTLCVQIVRKLHKEVTIFKCTLSKGYREIVFSADRALKLGHFPPRGRWEYILKTF